MMDLHCHVDLYPDHSKILSDIENSGYYVLSVTTVPSAFKGTVHLTENLANCRTALGLHPQLAHQRVNELSLFDSLCGVTRYIGEVGLDGSRGYAEHIETQKLVFEHILNKCCEFEDKILTIHSLNAVDEVLALLRKYPNSGTSVLHWFLATKKQVNHAAELGCYFSIGPAMINSARARKVISWLPKNRVLLETDGPFAKTDGKPALPSDVVHVIEFLSELWGKTIDQVQDNLKLTLKNLLSTKNV
ncbi:Qat anti-phage system TatD family nuclease QatD [Shewanella algae]|uniref:Qat anti-phage system TatD family nuclease QatD n=1 Tax=Shewanella algae TaxID=38313 RepID=UPI002554DE29|nr:Qat anti-phage system TatD family nuclease QatD [Shewanella algae]MDL2196516.1 TatD family hydrolase [Shewanella algae]